jgi:hypothetical protein
MNMVVEIAYNTRRQRRMSHDNTADPERYMAREVQRDTVLNMSTAAVGGMKQDTTSAVGRTPGTPQPYMRISCTKPALSPARYETLLCHEKQQRRRNSERYDIATSSHVAYVHGYDMRYTRGFAA